MKEKLSIILNIITLIICVSFAIHEFIISRKMQIRRDAIEYKILIQEAQIRIDYHNLKRLHETTKAHR